MKSICFIIYMFCIGTSISQVDCIDKNKASCEIDSSDHVFDYFNQRIDTLFCEYGRAILMDCMPYLFHNKKPIYTTRKSTYKKEYIGYGLLDIFVDNKLLFRYEMYFNKVEGTGKIFYPDSGKIAYQATFNDGKLNGVLFFLSKDNTQVIHSMLFKKGKPKKILYVWNIKQTKNNYRQINRRKYFKKGKCTSVVKYPFEI